MWYRSYITYLPLTLGFDFTRYILSNVISSIAISQRKLLPRSAIKLIWNKMSEKNWLPNFSWLMFINQSRHTESKLYFSKEKNQTFLAQSLPFNILVFSIFLLCIVSFFGLLVSQWVDLCLNSVKKISEQCPKTLAWYFYFFDLEQVFTFKLNSF